MTQSAVNPLSRWCALALVLALIVLCFVPVPVAGIYAQCPLLDRLLYPLFHVSLVHCGLNVWCFLALVFFYDIPLWHLLLAYAFSVSVPDCWLPGIHSLGLSGVCFALMGMVSLRVARRCRFLAWVAFYLVIGFFIPGVNAALHLFCFAAGLVFAFLFSPIRLWMLLTK